MREVTGERPLQSLKNKAAAARAAAGPSTIPQGLAQFDHDVLLLSKKIKRSVLMVTVKSQVKGILLSIPGFGYVFRIAIALFQLPKRFDGIFANIDSMSRDLRLHAGRLHRVESFDAKITQSEKNISDLRTDINDLRHLVENVREIYHRLGHADSIAPDPRLDRYYFEFENHFRGSQEQIAKRVSAYTPHLKNLAAQSEKPSLLDIGCGRGEWMRLAQSLGFRATGVDLNIRMIEECKAQNLEVHHGDAIEHLHKMPDNSVDVISGFHIVEHIRFEQLMRLFFECFRVLKPGGFVLFETPNPENVLVGSCNFYTDPTHRNPIPPTSLNFMLSFVGFKRQDCIRLSAPERPVAASTNTPEDIQAVIDRFYTEQDYAILGYKA